MIDIDELLRLPASHYEMNSFAIFAILRVRIDNGTKTSTEHHYNKPHTDYMGKIYELLAHEFRQWSNRQSENYTQFVLEKNILVIAAIYHWPKIDLSTFVL